MVKNLPAVWETWVQSLGWKDLLEKGMATPGFLPGESRGQRSLVGYGPRGCKELDRLNDQHFHFFRILSSSHSSIRRS